MNNNSECIDANYRTITVGEEVVILHLTSKELEIWYNKQPFNLLKVTKVIPAKEEIYVKGWSKPIDMLSVLIIENIN